MPIYEFQCRRCEHAFEALVDAGEQVECPKCRATELERLLSVPAKPVNGPMPLKTACNAAPGTPPCGPACARWPG
jgi:putative FmdB family regulatory protein